MLVREAMNKDVKTIGEDETIRQAAELMVKYRIGSLLVLSETGQLLGIVTERDILRDVVARSVRSEDVTVKEVMSGDLITIPPDISLVDAANIMTANKVKKLPVIENEQLVGIITASDLISYEQKLIEKVAELLVAPDIEKVSG